MSQKLIEEYTDFVDKVTSEASKSSDKMNERIEYLNSNGIRAAENGQNMHKPLRNKVFTNAKNPHQKRCSQIFRRL